MLSWNSQLKPGDVLTSISLLLALTGFLYTWSKDRNLKRREYADRIRQAAAGTVVALERWKELALRLHDDIQPLITEADVMAAGHEMELENVIKVREFFWHGLVSARATASLRIVAENIESAYLGLYGYEPRVQVLYDQITSSLKRADEESFLKLLAETQADTLSLRKIVGPIESAQLGNLLRLTTSDTASELHDKMGTIVDNFRTEMMRLITATDLEIANKNVEVAISVNRDDVPKTSSQGASQPMGSSVREIQG